MVLLRHLCAGPIKWSELTFQEILISGILWFDLNHGGFPPHNMARLSAFLLQALFYANACSGWMLGLWKEVL
jgi:hypothetical protein